MSLPDICPVADRYEWLPGRLTGGPMYSTQGLVLHVNAGNGDPFNWWTNPVAPTSSSHFQLMKDGTLIQYVPLNVVAWCQVAGSGGWHSIETEGWPDEPLTDAALDKLAELYAWGEIHCGWTAQLTDDPNGVGFGWHGMGGDAWGGHYGCPGDDRKAQRAEILNKAWAVNNPGPIVGSDPVTAAIDKIPEVDPGRDVGHPHTVAVIESLLRIANPGVDLSSKAKKSAAVKVWQAIFFNDWHVTGGKNVGRVTGKVDHETLANLLVVATAEAR